MSCSTSDSELEVEKLGRRCRTYGPEPVLHDADHHPRQPHGAGIGDQSLHQSAGHVGEGGSIVGSQCGCSVSTNDISIRRCSSRFDVR